MAWLYRKNERDMWTVGFYTPKGEWETESDHLTREAAAERVNYLNGGGGASADDVAAAALFLRDEL